MANGKTVVGRIAAVTIPTTGIRVNDARNARYDLGLLEYRLVDLSIEPSRLKQ